MKQFSYTILQYSPVADPLVLYTSTIVAVDDGPLRTSPICAVVTFSLTLDAGCVKFTVRAK